MPKMEENVKQLARAQQLILGAYSKQRNFVYKKYYVGLRCPKLTFGLTSSTDVIDQPAVQMTLIWKITITYNVLLIQM